MSEKIIHMHHYNFFKSWHIFALLVPAILFAFTIAFFNSDAQIKGSATAISVVEPESKILIKLGDVEVMATISDNELSRRKGLSVYDSLGQNEGMLFVFESRNVEHVSFWMKDMSFPIDILWIDNGKVVQIHENAQPQPGVPESELKYYLSDQPIDYVLEVNAGFSSENNISIGTEIKLNQSQ